MEAGTYDPDRDTGEVLEKIEELEEVAEKIRPMLGGTAKSKNPFFYHFEKKTGLTFHATKKH